MLFTIDIGGENKVSVTLKTYEKLKTFSRFHGLKLNLVIEAMVDLLLQDEQLCNRIIDLCVELEESEEF